MPTTSNEHIYDGDVDQILEGLDQSDRVILLPDRPGSKQPDPRRRLRIMWGQWLLDDILAGRYRSFVCAVNAEDNSHGIISQLANLLKTSQWVETRITAHVRRLVQPTKVAVAKFDMDTVEILALLRPKEHEHLTLDDLSLGFTLVTEMVARKPSRVPSASVSFLGARANVLVDETGREPSFETVLRTMYEAGYSGDVYPATWMWGSAPTGVFARYPFPDSVERMREGGF